MICSCFNLTENCVTKEQTLCFEAMKGCYNKAIQRKTRRQRLPLQQMSMPVVLQPNTKVTTKVYQMTGSW